MSNFLKSNGRRLSGGWFSFWAAALLILPNCTFSAPVGDGDNLDRGPLPHTAAVFCDIELARRCATPEDLTMGTRLASAAVALMSPAWTLICISSLLPPLRLVRRMESL